MSVEAILRGKTLSAKEFSEVLMNEVKNGHARLHHPFYLALYDGKLSLDEIRIWAKEAWGIFAYNVAINTAKLVRCQLSGIHDPEIHKKFVDIIHSEVGYQYFEGSPRRYRGTARSSSLRRKHRHSGRGVGTLRTGGRLPADDRVGPRGLARHCA